MYIDTAEDVQKSAGEFVYRILWVQTPNSFHPTSLVWTKAVNVWTHMPAHKPVNTMMESMTIGSVSLSFSLNSPSLFVARKAQERS